MSAGMEIYICLFLFFNDTATTEIYTLSLHDALPIYTNRSLRYLRVGNRRPTRSDRDRRSEEHTSELQSPCNLVCRLLLENKNKLRALVDAQELARVAAANGLDCVLH